jgi:hypothetical protein
VPFATRKPDRSPLQRLNDQRRSVALAGLAVGAIFSAVIFRRRRRGGEPEFEPSPPAPPPVKPQSESGTPAAVEPATGELNAAEAAILAVLAQSGRADDDRTTIAVATSLERDATDVTEVLHKLSAEDIVSDDLYTASGDKIWAVTERGVRRLGAQS